MAIMLCVLGGNMAGFANSQERMNQFPPGESPPSASPKADRVTDPALVGAFEKFWKLWLSSSTPPPTQPKRPGNARASEPPTVKPGDITVPSFWRKVRSYLGAVIGPRVTPGVYRERMVACATCPEIDVIHKRYADKLYCGACNCWRWRPAKLERKNRYAYHCCPKGRHPGQSQNQSGCAGCGDAKS